MVLYQLESLHFDDYNLTYSQNKNRGFDKFLTATPLKIQHFPVSLFLVGIGIITFGSPKLKLRHFNAKLVDMPSSLDHLLLFSNSRVLTP